VRKSDAAGQFGQVVPGTSRWLADQHPYVTLDEWCVVPDHVHGILVLGGSQTGFHCDRRPIGRLVGAFKTVSTKQINLMRGTPGTMVWQPGYHDRPIRDDEERRRIREYIRTNSRGGS
jgi:REP element-mobilizing transposase RayT